MAHGFPQIQIEAGPQVPWSFVDPKKWAPPDLPDETVQVPNVTELFNGMIQNSWRLRLKHDEIMDCTTPASIKGY